ncbi:Na/Pi symporter [Litorivicinus sp.]|nr:Na/Pi symporter [Litorivicinus sp.]
MLLLFSVRMVRTGILRGFESSLSRVVRSVDNSFAGLVSGISVAVLLQSSLTAILLMSGVVGTFGFQSFSALTFILGADLGSALVVYFLSLDIHFLVPIFLSIGGYLFLRDTTILQKHVGRIFLGLALILVSLEFLRDAVLPIQESTFLVQLSELLARDYLTAFILGAVLAFLMHSSVASILVFAALVSTEAFSVEVGLSLMLGANLGSSILVLWVTQKSVADVRQITLAASFVRITGAFVALFLLNIFGLSILGPLDASHSSELIIVSHIVFNASLILFIPLLPLFLCVARNLLPPDLSVPANESGILATALESSVRQQPALGISNIQREIYRMIERVETLMVPVMSLLNQYDSDKAKYLIEEDEHLNHSLDAIRNYAALLSSLKLEPEDKKRIGYLLDYASVVEAAGDTISKRLLPLAEKKDRDSQRFSKQGHDEILLLHSKSLDNLSLCGNLLLSNSFGVAKNLFEQKQEFSALYRKSRKKHLKRLAEGKVSSISSSDLHLDVCLAFKDFNSRISSVAHAVLSAEGYFTGTFTETLLRQ